MKTIRLVSMALLPTLAIVFSASSAEARTRFKVIHSFAGGDTDGANPYGGVAPNGLGGFYIATDTGGTISRGLQTENVTAASGSRPAVESRCGSALSRRMK
jgi:hypothetical protein